MNEFDVLFKMILVDIFNYGLEVSDYLFFGDDVIS